MFNNNTYQILRLYNSEIYSSYIFRNDYRAKAVLLKLYKAYNQDIKYHDNIDVFSRKNQSKELIKLIDSIC